ncbi:MAG: hypothetical protein HY360_25420 [Verrucomicrobia bacterium]|nr:hypothetical protein [Verrucomicrobiota bacterium]
MGRKPRFKSKPKEKVVITIRKPGWLRAKSPLEGGLNPAKAVDALTGQTVSCRVENQNIRLDLGTVELGKIVAIQ